jgi:hypothetical protein
MLSIWPSAAPSDRDRSNGTLQDFYAWDMLEGFVRARGRSALEEGGALVRLVGYGPGRCITGNRNVGSFGKERAVR